MKQNDNSKNILNAPILPTLLSFSIPNILSFGAIISSAVINAVSVGHFAGENSLAAVNIVSPIFSIIFGPALMFITGGAVRTGKYIGEKKLDEARAMFTKTIIAVIFISSIVALFAIFKSRAFAGALGANSDLVDLSASFLKTLGFFIVLMPLGYALSVFTRIDGSPFFASAIVMSSSLVNILCNLLFVGYFKMDVVGAALGTGIANIYIVVFFLARFASSKRSLKFTKNIGEWSELFRSAYNGLSEFVNEVSVGTVVFLFNYIMITRVGTTGVAAFSAINYMMFIGGMISYAMSDSTATLISINFGAKKFDRIKKFLRLALFFVFGNGFTIFIILTFFPERLINLFLADMSSGSFEIAMEFASYIRWAFLFNGVNIMLSAYFTALHRALESATVSILRSLIFPVTLLYFGSKLFGNVGIYLAIPIAEIVTLAVAIYLLRAVNRFYQI